MGKKIALVAAAALGLMASYSAATAQSFGIYIGPSYGYDRYDDYYGSRYTYAPRVYRYYRSYDDDGDTVVRSRSRGRGGCGTYHYWNGERCVDARYK